MIALINYILDILNDDMLSYGLLAQVAKEDSTPPQVEDVLRDLLESGKVEIGETKMASPDYVEFIAWKGTVDERIQRASNAVSHSTWPDKEFAFWLCLRENVDRFEDEEG